MTCLLAPRCGDARGLRFIRGFTLIEMSLVLVVIGLIIGGILKGQELITSSREKSMMRDVNSIKAGLLTFQERYQYWPGDYPNASTRINANLLDGNGNGSVARFNGSGVAQTRRTPRTQWRQTGLNNNNFREHHYAWMHLSYSDILPIANASTDTADYDGYVHYPEGAHPSARFELSHSQGQLRAGDNELPLGLYIRYSTFKSSNRRPDGVMDAAQAQRIDRKYDDGVPFDNGNNLEGYRAFIFATSGNSNANQDCVSNQEQYQVTNRTDKACVLFFKMDG